MLAVKNQRCAHQFYADACPVASCPHAEPIKPKAERKTRAVPLAAVPVRETASEMVARCVAKAEEYRERAHWRVSQWMHEPKK